MTEIGVGGGDEVFHTLSLNCLFQLRFYFLKNIVYHISSHILYQGFPNEEAGFGAVRFDTIC